MHHSIKNKNIDTHTQTHTHTHACTHRHTHIPARQKAAQHTWTLLVISAAKVLFLRVTGIGQNFQSHGWKIVQEENVYANYFHRCQDFAVATVQPL